MTPAAKSMPASQTSDAGVAGPPASTSGADQDVDESRELLADVDWDMALRERYGEESLSMG